MSFKNKIILFGAITIAFLLTIPRGLIQLFGIEVTVNYNYSLVEYFIYGSSMFVLAWFFLSFNLKWKKKWFSVQVINPIITDVLLNLVLLFLIIALMTICRHYFISNNFDVKWFFILFYFGNIISISLILLFSWLVLTFEESQQNLLEKQQVKQQALNHQLEALRNQVNPHFLFNSLNSLHTLVLKKSDNAIPFIESLSWLLSQTLQRSKKEYISLGEELEYLNAYMFLQKERFGDKLSIDISIPETWEKEIIPSFSLQLLVENAIKHNIVSSALPLAIKIYTDRTSIIVSNPFQKRRDAVKSIGMGLSNLSERFKILKKRDIHIEQKENLFTVKLQII